MASILDQYEIESARASSGSISRTATPSQVDLISKGFIDARMLEVDQPIFSKKKVNFKPPDSITHMQVCNNFLVMVMSGNMLLRLDLEHTDQQDEIEIPHAVEDKVHKIFLDPTGRHLIIGMTSTENYYLSRTSKKPKQIPKLKSHLIESVGWNWQNASESTTSAILLGTSKGLIFETELTASEDARFFQSSLDLYLKQLYNLGREKAVPVTGLAFERMPSDVMTEYRYFILATTPGRFYQFLGTVSSSQEPPMFFNLFQQYETGPGIPMANVMTLSWLWKSSHKTESFVELPGDFGYSELHLFYPKFRGQPQTFAWMSGPGIYFGDINITGTASPNTITSNAKLISYPHESEEQTPRPLGMLLTEFHALVLFQDRLRVLCLLNEQPIQDDVFADRFGKVQGLCKDPIRGSMWAYTTHSIFKYKVTSETRDVWRMYLDKGDFERAKAYAKDNPMHMDTALTKEAEHLFSQGKHAESAVLYAKTQNSFEEVALKFIKLNQKEPLQQFLMQKLNSLRPSDRTQVTMLVTWLVELYLDRLGQLKDRCLDNTPEFKQTSRELQTFLANPTIKDTASDCRCVIYDLLASHGDVENMVFFAMLMKDCEKVLTHYIRHENYTGAVEVLLKQSDPELYYKFSPLLMQYVPKETVDMLIKAGKSLNPQHLIPALVQYDHQRYQQQENEVIRYLEFCVESLGNRDTAIHNYILSLYAKHQPSHLMTYLQTQGDDPDKICYDVKYAERRCRECQHKKACVHIYSLMGLYEEAVDMALEVDVDLAKQVANKPDEDDVELRRNLWLRIARHVVEKEKDIKRAMEFLHECDLLKIEDVLPFFPNFTTIDHFKDAIIQSLQEYNQHIDSLKEEMEEATQSAEEIRKEIQSFRNKYTVVKVEDKCYTCNFPLMTRGFYFFPCGHKFHADCLIAEVLPSLAASKRSKVEGLQRKLAERSDIDPRRKPNDDKTISMAEIKAELDDIIAAECILCGDYTIRCIDVPLLTEDELKTSEEEWL